VKVLTTRVEDAEIKELDKIVEVEKTERSVIARKLLARGLTQWKHEFALKQVKERKLSIRAAAKMAGLSYIEMLDALAKEGIDIGYSLKDLEKDLAKL